jgi:hypothetical protein
MGHLGGGSERDVRLTTGQSRVQAIYSRVHSQIKALSKIPIPIWLAYTIIYSSVHDLCLIQLRLTLF